ncbi:uncharacterized protein DUF222 [Arthrobacter sp. SLBN-122]|nr:uncharacterized protein DUF222 [Arthrobacter sp. SLBN-122]
MRISSGVGVALEGVHTSVAALDALAAEDSFLAAGVGVGPDVNVLQRRYELRLARLEVSSRLRAQLAAVEARDAVECVGFQHAMLAPDAPVHERKYAEMSAVEEIAGILTISSGAAGAFVEQSRRVCSLPPVLEALSAGALSWQHAKIIADETEGLTPAGAAALVAHFFDSHAPNLARGAAPGELVPSRFRARVRAWRERHHPESLQKRHAKGVADRRMEYTPDRDGMAWISLRLPGHTASAIWNRTTATARGLQGPDEPRTITQLRPDIAASLLLGASLLANRDTTNAADAAAGSETSSATGAGNTTSPQIALGAGSPAGAAGLMEIGKVPAPRADVLVMVPVFSLFGITDEPAELDGHGPIPASMARKLVADGADSFYRVLIDPRDGAPLEIGRTRYRSRRPSNSGSGCGTANAASLAAATAPLTTRATTSPPGKTAAPPAPATWHNSAQNITGSSTPGHGSPTAQPTTDRPAGPHPQAATTNPNTQTPTRPTGHQESWNH